MRIGLVSYRCQNKDFAFNLGQIERAMREAHEKADLLCFGEAFLQGFDSLCWNYEADREMALESTSGPILQLAQWTEQYHTALLTGYIERAQERLYSSCIVLADGKMIHHYRRISKGWKESSKTDAHYAEGNETGAFRFLNKDITLALCGDLWDFPGRFRTGGLLIWPVYVNFSIAEWEERELAGYARQASLASDNVLMVNPIDRDPENHGGAFFSKTERSPAASRSIRKRFSSWMYDRGSWNEMSFRFSRLSVAPFHRSSDSQFFRRCKAIQPPACGIRRGEARPVAAHAGAVQKIG